VGDRMMDVIQKVEKKYGPLDTEWVAEKGKVIETRLIKELALEVTKLQKVLYRKQAYINSLVEEVE